MHPAKCSGVKRVPRDPPELYRVDHSTRDVAGQLQQRMQESEVQLAAAALSSDEVRGCELPAVKHQLLAVITNLIPLSGMPLQHHSRSPTETVRPGPACMTQSAPMFFPSQACTFSTRGDRRRKRSVLARMILEELADVHMSAHVCRGNGGVNGLYQVVQSTGPFFVALRLALASYSTHSHCSHQMFKEGAEKPCSC